MLAAFAAVVANAEHAENSCKEAHWETVTGLCSSSHTVEKVKVNRMQLTAESLFYVSRVSCTLAKGQEVGVPVYG